MAQITSGDPILTDYLKQKNTGAAAAAAIQWFTDGPLSGILTPCTVTNSPGIS